MTNELYHYGVLGMKWGIRKNPSKAFGKAVTKAKRLSEKADKAMIKAEKKTHAHLTDFGVSAERRASRKAIKSAGKNKNWEKKMKKSFKDVKISEIDSETLKLGEKYIHMLQGAK